MKSKDLSTLCKLVDRGDLAACYPLLDVLEENSDFRITDLVPLIGVMISSSQKAEDRFRDRVEVANQQGYPIETLERDLHSSRTHLVDRFLTDFRRIFWREIIGDPLKVLETLRDNTSESQKWLGEHPEEYVSEEYGEVVHQDPNTMGDG